MNSLSKQFFTKAMEKPFSSVRILSEEPDCSWEEVSKITLDFPRPWYELSRISSQDRVEFTRDFWLDRIPYHPNVHPALFEFFERLDDVAVVLVQKVEGELMDAELVYSLKDNSSFFRGKYPAKDTEIQEVKSELNLNLPRDYLSFVKIHNGFGKLSEIGLFGIQDIPDARRRVVDLILSSDKSVKSGEMEIDPRALIPFYEVLGLSSFQCFYTDWYPGSEMGNVYFSGIDYTISDVANKKAWIENLSFPTFSMWLSYYLQGMDLCT